MRKLHQSCDKIHMKALGCLRRVSHGEYIKMLMFDDVVATLVWYKFGSKRITPGFLQSGSYRMWRSNI